MVKNAKARVSRAMLFTVTALLVLALFIPLVMGGVDRWNNAINQSAGHNYWLRTSDDLLLTDNNSTYNGAVLFNYYNATNVEKWAEQTVSYGPSVNSGYHTIPLIVGANEGNSSEEDSLNWRLNVTTKNFRDNSTYQLSMDLSGFGGIKPTVYVYAHRVNKSLAATGDSNIYLIGSTNYTTALNTNTTTLVFETVDVEFSYLDIITAEDEIGTLDNYILIKVVANTGNISETDSCYFRIYTDNMDAAGTISHASAVSFTQFVIGLFMLSCALFATPNFDVVGTTAGQAVSEYRGSRKQGRRRY